MKEPEFRGPRICSVGVNYSSTPLAVREMLGIPKAQIQEALSSLRNYVPKGVILATCNRTEVYALDDEHHSGEHAIRRFLQNWGSLSEGELAPYLYIHYDYRAMRRLSKISAGLYSMILGEHEVLGQVRQSLEEAEKAGMVNAPLRRLFENAIRTGRRVRAETGLSKNALSVSSVAVELATRVTGRDARDSRVLLVGAGEAGKLVARAFARRGAPTITVASRSLESARELASAFGGRAVDIQEMGVEMAAADIVISCTGAPHFVIHQEHIEKVMSERPNRPLVIVDIAVPRDVEPGVKEIDGVVLYDIDDLNRVLGDNREERERAVEESLSIVSAELERLLEWWQTLEGKPTIAALTEKAERIRERQLEMTLKKLPPLTPEQRESLESMTRSIVNKLLHDPIQRIKENGHESDDYVRMVRELFALDREIKK